MRSQMEEKKDKGLINITEVIYCIYLYFIQIK